MIRGLSLADKCQLLFGAAILVLLSGALLVPWFVMGAIVDASQLETSRQLAILWQQAERSAGWPLALRTEDAPRDSDAAGQRIEVFEGARLEAASSSSPFVGAAVRRFTAEPGRTGPASEHTESVWEDAARVYRYALAQRDQETGELTGVVLVERRSPRAADQLFVNRMYVVAAGLLAGALAILAFYLITMRIILSPVRQLRRTAERVREGDLSSRAEIQTGDEFEELAQTFNAMLENIGAAQDQLRSSNRSLDLRINELAQSNVALHEAARLKGEFLANVSHELRTPLNSIIGFAELLQEIAQGDASAAEITPERHAQFARRNRYLENIVGAGRSLLEMINELLDMARIEAGKLDLRLEPMNVEETCEGLGALIRPLADRKSIRLVLETPATREAAAGRPEAPLPLVTTDPRKFQQIVFNFLSNAVKFTPEGGMVTLRAERLVGSDGEPRVRVSVLDTGPGIAEEDQKTIFEKFRQLDGGHTRHHAGTGLGLAIAKELAHALQGEIHVVSAPASGSMFSLLVPLEIELPKPPEPAAADDADAPAGVEDAEPEPGDDTRETSPDADDAGPRGAADTLTT
ncbi:MAG: sensor histidine kinase [Phycisphaerales bacterium]|nr:MAG: sensor histidine kinase [Phycisphaerales bacterium]